MSQPLGTARAPREVELKFHLSEGSRAVLEKFPSLAAAKSEQRDLVTTYFDTPDRDLNRCGLSLRVRRDGETRTQTVKSRSDGHGVAVSRGEWEWPIDQDAPELIWLANTKPLAAAARSVEGRLQPAFVTRIRRTTHLVHLGEGTTVEVAFDEGDIAAGPAHEAVRELELELKSGGVGPLYRLAAALLSTAPLWLMSESKASRGWRLRTGQSEGAQLALPLTLKRKVSAAAGFRQLLGGALGHLTANIGATVQGDSEGLHQSRIAIRQARAVLQLFDQHLDVESARRFMGSLRTYGEVLGAARDWDVFCLETLPSAMPDLSTERVEDLNAAAEVERQLAHEAVVIAVQSRAFSELVLAMMIWSEGGAIAPSAQDNDSTTQHLSSLAPSLLARAARTVSHRGRHIGQLSEEERHSLRKALKKLSFDVECLSRFFGHKAVKHYRRRCEVLEKSLGAANDAVVTGRLTHELLAADRPELSDPAGAVEHWNRLRERKALRGLETAMGNVRHAPAFWLQT